MTRAREPHRGRQPRTESRRRRQQARRYRRFLAQTAFGTLLPGVGLIAAGKRRTGGFLVTVLVLAIIAALGAFVVLPREQLISYGGDRQMLLLLGAGLVTVAAIWLLIALVSHRLLEPRGLSAGKRFAGALVVVAVASLVVAPLSMAGYHAFTQRDLIESISGGRSHTTPDIEDDADPWADIDRLNLLLLGGDAGEGRKGLRPDTIIVASVDTETGDTTMIGVPRNLQHPPFADDSPLAEIYPHGFDGPDPDPQMWMINAVYRHVPDLHPELFEDVDNPGADATKWAVEGTLGIDVDYFVSVNMEGFQRLVDAVGGVTVDVPRDIPIGNKTRKNGPGCTQPRDYILAGDDQKLDGAQALWFARSRCGASDYDRMARQQCLLGAMAEQTKPSTVFTQYQSIASATEDIIQSDIPEDLFPALIELGLKVRDSSITSLTIDNEFFREFGMSSSNPDYEVIHNEVAEILAPDGGTPNNTEDSRDTQDAQGDSANDTGTGGDDAEQPGADDPTGGSPDEGGDHSGDTDQGETGEETEPPDPDEPVDPESAC
ncbi:LytR family transcriptional regulator [Actinobacteria bacterium YIM 96077]|uniref:LytR family transcriptional regulator n=1 Tax=Phytoactinopolyspora halophila TaxID=1981511 RepID=A0A329QDV3_9ACTN|nr:LCP family protein [Phytoactinopolyspora halophila]AYY11838.1 LytR family transcriptional regulator [Actinobacteria bacterium YIM 96077]RAW09859.1 LytR family transcriptional regulator [Phytoactinopolyspora halophila]